MQKKLVAAVIASGEGNWEAGGGGESSMLLSPCDVWISYHVHILFLWKRFILGAQFSDQKVLKYPFYLIYSPPPSLEGLGIMEWDLGIGSSIDPAFWVLLPDSELAAWGQGTITLAVPGTMSVISRDTDYLWVNLTYYPVPFDLLLKPQAWKDSLPLILPLPWHDV